MKVEVGSNGDGDLRLFGYKEECEICLGLICWILMCYLFIYL